MINTVPRKFQWEGVKRIEELDGLALLADEMGLGKSFQALLYIYRQKFHRPVIIVTPAALKYTWQREALHHLNLRADVLSGRKVRKNSFGFHSKIIIINYEILHNWVDYLVKLRPIAIVWDESHYIANRTTQRYNALKFLCEQSQAPHRIALSGTPLTNRPAELWTTLHLLRPEVWKSFYKFGKAYCRPKIVRGKWTYVGAQRLDRLHERLTRRVMIRRLKKDVAKELPDKIRKLIAIELSPADRKEYDFCAKNFLTWLKLRHPERVNKARRAERLVKPGYLLRLTAKLKRFEVANWIDDFAQESDDKLVVFSSHTKMIRWLARRYKGKCVIIDGTVTGRKRQDAVDAFQHDRSIRYAFCHPKAAGVGLTLTASSTVCYTDFPYTPGTLKQGEDRIHRIGQKKQCVIYFLAARGTFEERLMELLTEKQAILDKVLDGIDDGKDFDVFQRLWEYVERQAA